MGKTTTRRLKGSGMRWDGPNAEAVMALTTLDQSGHWTGSWQTCLKPTGGGGQKIWPHPVRQSVVRRRLFFPTDRSDNECWPGEAAWCWVGGFGVEGSKTRGINPCPAGSWGARSGGRVRVPGEGPGNRARRMGAPVRLSELRDVGGWRRLVGLCHAGRRRRRVWHGGVRYGHHGLWLRRLQPLWTGALPSQSLRGQLQVQRFVGSGGQRDGPP
jgi:hypothetical protein